MGKSAYTRKRVGDKIGMKNISKDANNLLGQPMFQLLAKAKELESQGRNISHLEIGEPDFLSPRDVTEAAITVLKEGKTRYVNSMGIDELREAV